MAEHKILLVDDVDYTRQLLRNNIMAICQSGKVSHKSYTFFNASKAAAAMDLFSLQLPAIVFLDIELPDASGLELLKKFKALKPDCFIVMVSGVSTLDNVRQSMADGAASFIVKPFTGDKILAALRLYERFRAQ
ncbi:MULTISPECIES: response regulator [Alkalimonas]|uniref:Response regulator n=1 Tax=Alkalimonas mucilaginosa TaxID=3057676 RepID=A0ABU7JFT9_9GAMM|nr:response regulator [Alkalimonas sp. MEB004]MEE2024553.1 response regulator [Alkalimonas sp. MEB004]